MKRIALLIGTLCFSVLVHAQLTGGKYKIQYNTSTCQYDIFLVPDGGSATSTGTLTPRTSRVTLVVPHGSNIGATVFGNEPHDVNSDPVAWVRHDYYGKSLSNGATGLTGFDVAAYDVDPNGTMYPSITTTSPLLLFSLTIALPAGNVCGAGVRLWRNNNAYGNTTPNDPTSANIGNLTDYNNSFKIGTDPNGGQLEKFTGLSGPNSVTLPAPTITPFTLGISGGNITASSAITSGSSSCTSLQSYTWSKPSPNSYSNTTAVSGTSATATLSRPLNAANLGTYTLTVTNINGCTASASNSIALPIKLLSFKGAANKCAAQLSWEVAHGEKDFQGFDLQYSTDGAHFGTISHVERSQYNDAYSSSYIQASGKGYYRLKVTDLAGKESYSETVIVTTDCDNPEITIAPNPTQALSTVSGIASGDQVKVTDMLGNVIANYVSGGSRATIDLGIFPSGIYSVMISRGTDILKTAKITKL